MNIMQRLKNIFGDDFVTRFTEDELLLYVEEGVVEFSRRSGAFIMEFTLGVTPSGIIHLPPEVISVVSCGDLPLKSWRSIASLYGGQWYNKKSRDAECYITDFDSANQFRLFPIPEKTKVDVKCIIGVGTITFDNVNEAITSYVAAIMLLREYNAEANIYLKRFDELARPPLVKTTLKNGIKNKGVWF